jgi:hypothetical protein
MALADRWHADGEAADATRALRAVDMAFIMGGPVESLQQLLRTVEPCARASLRPQPDALNASPLPDATPGPVPTTPLLSGASSLYFTQRGDRVAATSAQDCGIVSGAADGWRAEGSHIPRVAASELSVKEFKKQFFKADKPVVIEGCMEGWAALHKWSEPCWWRREHGHRTVPIELGVHAAGTLRERLMTLAEFVDEHLDRAPEEETACCPAYLAQHTLLDQIPQLMDDVTVPVYCQAGSHEVTNLWLGTAATATTLHFDSYDNLLCQVAGYKYVRLYAPAQSGKLYQDQRGHQGMATRSQGNLSQVDVGNVDTDRFPLFEQAPFLDAVLRSGDVLYIPSRWWHYVRSLSASCTCNFWF